MIREIINFTRDLLADIPDIRHWNAKPDKGLHVFIDIDENGRWVNKKLKEGVDYAYYDGENEDIKLWDDCIRYQEATTYINFTKNPLNKVKKFDPKQKIHSCSPFAIAYNFKVDKKALGIPVLKKSEKPSKDDIKKNEALIRNKKYEVVYGRLSDYKKNCIAVYGLNFTESSDELFPEPSYEFKNQINGFFSEFPNVLTAIKNLKEYNLLKAEDYLHIYLRSVPIEEQEKQYRHYLEQEIFSGDVFSDKSHGTVGFFTTYNQGKTFLRHQTGYQIGGVSQRVSTEDAMILYEFMILLRRKCFPNPLPIVVDQKEINKAIAKIYNESGEKMSTRQILTQLFQKKNIKYLSDFYLLNLKNTMSGYVINDFDFVSLFRFGLVPTIRIFNLMEAGYYVNDKMNKDPDIQIQTIFDFEKIAVRTIFNNSLVRIKDDTCVTHYFDDLDPKYVPGGNMMVDLIYKYRMCIYEYIYKSKTGGITRNMIDDMLLTSIKTNILNDKIKGRTEWNNPIKTKLNLWFSLYDFFSNNKENAMTSRIKELKTKLYEVSLGEADLETQEEFAFAAGQLISYLIDRSAASNKTYALLEPYLQKSKISMLQTSLSQSIATYKHDIRVVHKGRFENIAAQALTFAPDGEMKPLLRYLLAGCFSPCVIYEKKEQTTGNKE